MAKGSDRRDPADRGHAPARGNGRSPRKNTKTWCRGKVGVPHLPHVVLPSGWRGHRACGPRPLWAATVRAFAARGDWWCSHRVECSSCGKVLQDRYTGPCPNRPVE